jgi:hypothetical protein
MAGDHEAAKLLQTWLRKAHGVDEGFEKVSAGDATTPDGKLILALGRTRWVADEELEPLDAHGFLIRRKGNVVVLTGGTPQATLWAAVHFLDRFAGVRFYMPGDLFTSVPRQPPGPIGAIDIREEPYVRSCTITGMHNDYHREKPWTARVAADRRRGGSHQHNMFARFDPARYAERNPEIYPILEDKRYLPKRGDRFWQPCLSEPRLVDAAVDSALRYFKENPDAEYVGFSVEDGKQFCECDRCLTDWEQEKRRLIAEGHDPEEAGETALNVIHSTLYWTFLNRTAARLEQQLPEHGIDRAKLIVGLVYSRARHNPGIKLHPNVLAWFVFKWSDGLIDQRLIPQPDGSYRLGRIDDWLSVASHIGHHDWAHGKGILIPRIYTGLVSESFRLFQPHDLIYLHTEGYPNWGLDGPKLYVHSRIWWNPQVDVRAIWRDFCDDMFGPASEPMHNYFSTLEQLWISLNHDTERKLNRWWSQFDTTPEQRATIAHCRALLDKAAALAETPEQEQRIDLFSKSFRLSEYLFALAATEKVTRDEVDEVLQYAETVIRPDPMTVYRNDREGDYAYEQIESAVWTLASRRGLKRP